MDYWLHADDDGTPWLLVSLDIVEDHAVRDTLRLDFDERGIRGGWSPACLDWDDGMRAEEALIELSGPDGLLHPADGSSVEDLARRAADGIQTHSAEFAARRAVRPGRTSPGNDRGTRRGLWRE